MGLYDILTSIKNVIATNFSDKIIFFDTVPVENVNVPCVVFSSTTVEEEKSFTFSLSTISLEIVFLANTFRECVSGAEQLVQLLNNWNFSGFTCNVKNISFQSKEEGMPFFAATINLGITTIK